MQQLPDQNTPTGPSILIVGTNAPIIRFLSTGLKISGYTVRGCPYSPETLEIAREEKPGLILLECSVPTDEYLIFLKQLHEVVPPTCPLLVLMEHASDQKFQQNGATSLIPMPFDFDTLLVQVNGLIGHLNPQLSQQRKGFLYPINNPPPDLPEEFRSK